MRGEIALCFIVVLVSAVNYCFGCTCLPTHLQQKFCDSHYAVKAVVKKEEIIHSTHVVEENGTLSNVSTPMERKYTIKIQRIFKESEAFQNASQRYVYTSYSDSMCGVKLKRNHRYLLIGRIIDDSLLIGTCDGPTEWKTLTRHQKKGVSYMYNKHCDDCEIVSCFGQGCDYARRNRRRDTCILDGADDWTSSCAIQYGHCKLTRRVNGYCKWSPKKQIREGKCLKNRLP